MRNVARLKMGYYPLPESEGVKLRSLLPYSQTASVIVINPCVGQFESPKASRPSRATPSTQSSGRSPSRCST